MAARFCRQAQHRVSETDWGTQAEEDALFALLEGKSLKQLSPSCPTGYPPLPGLVEVAFAIIAAQRHLSIAPSES